MNVKFVNEAKSKQRKKNRTAVHKQTSLIAGSKKGSSQDCSAHNAATAFCLARRLQPSCVGMCMP